MTKRRGYHTVTLKLGKKGKKKLKLYTNQRVVNALKELRRAMTLYQFARFTQVLEAVHEHGRKAGARRVFHAVELLKIQIPHRRPGRPSN